MEYLYEKERENYEDFASGRVLFNAPGTTAFPVRLASEIYLRAKSHLRKMTTIDRYTVYDPCCGGAYLLTTLGMLHGADLRRLIGSEIDARAVELAGKNLSLVNTDGLNERIKQLKQLLDAHGKDSHRQAMESAERLHRRISRRDSSIEVHCFTADATMPADRAVFGNAVDLVITDVPYGDLVQWQAEGGNPLERMLDNLLSVLAPQSIAAVIADKRQVIEHANYRRIEKFKVGKRQVVLLAPL